MKGFFEVRSIRTWIADSPKGTAYLMTAVTAVVIFALFKLYPKYTILLFVK